MSLTNGKIAGITVVAYWTVLPRASSNSELQCEAPGPPAQQGRPNDEITIRACKTSEEAALHWSALGPKLPDM